MFFQSKVSWENYKPIRKSQWDSIGCECTNIFFQSKIILDIFKGAKDMDKEKEDEEKIDLEKEVVTASKS